MTRLSVRSLTSLLVLGAFLSGCCCGDDTSAGPVSNPQPVPTGDYIAAVEGAGTLLADRKGFRFEGGVRTTEPIAYPFLWIAHLDAYRDSARVVVLLQNEFKTITQSKVFNLHAGRSTRSYTTTSVPNDQSNSMKFQFNHPSFLITSLNSKTGNFNETGVVFGMQTQSNRPLSWVNSYGWEFMDNRILRFISGISLWPFSTGSWSDEPQFVATGELSDPKAVAHVFLEGFPNFPHDVKSNLYSGFFQSTNAGSYVGVSKGSTNLDTAYISNLDPTLYVHTSCAAYLDKRGDTLYLGAIIPLPRSNLGKLSVWRLIEGENVLVPLYRDIDPPARSLLVQFRSGRFYVNQGGTYSILDRDGTLKPSDLPGPTSGLSLSFGREKILGTIMATDLKSLEIYSRDY
jgi:hypothetical protein